jgi:elongation factor Ts
MMQCKAALIESNGEMEKAIDILRKQGQATAARRAGKAAKEGKITIINTPLFSVVFEVNCETDFVARNDDFIAFIDETGRLLSAKKPATMDQALGITSAAWDNRSISDRLTELIGKIGEKITFRRFSFVECNTVSEKIASYIHGNGKIGVLVKVKADNPGVEAVAAVGKDLAMQVAASRPVAIDRQSVPQAVVEKEREIYREQVKMSGKPEKIWDKIVEGKLGKYFEESVLVEQVYIKDTAIRVSDRIKQAEKEAGCGIVPVSFVRWELGSEE